MRFEDLEGDVARIRAPWLFDDPKRRRHALGAEDDLQVRRLQLPQDVRDRAAGIIPGLRLPAERNGWGTEHDD